MSDSDQDQENEATIASGSESEGSERSCTSPESDAQSAATGGTASPRSSVEFEDAEASGSSRSSDSTLNEDSDLSREDQVKVLLVQVEKDFQDLCLDEDKLRQGVECYLDRVIDIETLGIAFAVYREIKMGAYTANAVRMAQPPEDKNTRYRTDIFAEYYDKERKCICNHCMKLVLASGFAIHLEVCMGVKQGRTRNTRRVVSASSSRDVDSPARDSPQSSEDNDDDDDWSFSGEKRKRKRDRNGSKRFKGATTKKIDLKTDPNELSEAIEVVDNEAEIPEVVYEEEEPDDIFNLSEFFPDDSSQSNTSTSSTGLSSNASSDEVETKVELSSPSPTMSS